MPGPHPPAFGELLRRYRLAAGLSQGALAYHASVSVRGISDLERGVHSAPYRDTVEKLADALQLEGSDRSALEIASQRPRMSVAREGPDHDSAVGDTTLLMCKLMVPTGRSDLTVRPRLMDRLQFSRQCKLTVIAAPAGFGKTTALAQWHSTGIAGDVPVAWVSLDSADNDPGRFWRYTITALDRIHPGTATSALSRLQSPEVLPIEAVLTLLLHALSGLSSETVLVLDDYHLIDEQAIHEGVSFLLDHLPAGMHVIISTRDDPPLPLSRLRMRGDLLELRAADLRFTTNETGILLNEAMALKLSEEDVRTLEARTEGWIAGLQLAALAMRGRDDLDTFISAFAGSHRYVADYLMEEVLLRQPEAIQSFLLASSILDRMCASLCDALMGWETGSQPILEQLDRANVFVIPLDDTRVWYRYHHLFAEMLRRQLHASLPARVRELHEAASEWFDQQGSIAEAIHHAIAASDLERAAGMVEDSGWSIILAGQVPTVLGWLQELPDEMVRSRPSLSLLRGTALMYSGQMDSAETCLHDAEHGIDADAADDRMRTILGTVALVRANMAQFSGDIARFVALAHRAVELLPENAAAARGAAVRAAASEYALRGDVTQPSEGLVKQAVAVARASGDAVASLAAFTHLARMRMQQGRLRDAAATCKEAWQVADQAGGPQNLADGAGYHFTLGDLLREWNDLTAAQRELELGLDLVRGALRTNAIIVAVGYTATARMHRERMAFVTASSTLDELAKIAEERGFSGALCDAINAERAWMALTSGNLAAAMRWAEHSSLSPDDEVSFLREREYLTLTRVCIERGRKSVEDLGESPWEALRLLDRLLEDAETRGRMGSVIEIETLSALAFHLLGDTAAAMKRLERALSLGRAEGYVRTFVDEGAPMVALLLTFLRRPAAERTQGANRQLIAYAVQLLAILEPKMRTEPAVQVSYHADPVLPLLEPLTGREVETLQLIATGLSNRDIATTLFITVGTVKWYVNSIFSKLDVHSRTEAVARAGSLQILAT